MPLRKDYMPEQMDKAIKAVRNGEKVAVAAKSFGVPRVTLYNKVSGKTPINCTMGPITVLSKDQEDILVRWLLALAEKHFPISKDYLQDSVQKIIADQKISNPLTNNRPGKKHPVLVEKLPQNLSKARDNVSEKDIKMWFQEIDGYLEKNYLKEIVEDPTRVFNAEESRVIAKKGDKHLYSVCGDEKENLTVLFTGNAAGQLAPPMIKAVTKLKEDCIKNGFRAGGLCPFGPEYIDMTKLKRREEEQETVILNPELTSFVKYLEKKLKLFIELFYKNKNTVEHCLPMEDTSLYVIWAKSKSQFGSDILSNDSGVVNNRPDSEPTLQMTTPEPIDNNLSVTGSGNDGLSQVPPQNQDKESLNVSVPGENPTHQCSNRSQEDIQFQSTMSPKAIEPISNYAPVTEDEMAAIIDPIQDSIDPVTSLKHNPKSNSNSKLLTMEHPTTNNNIFESVSTPKIPNEVSSDGNVAIPGPKGITKRQKRQPKRQRTHSHRDTSDSEMDVPLMKLNTSKSVAGPKISLECYVIVLYEGEYFPGKVENVNEKQYEVSTMTLSTGNSFRWPEKPDKIWYKVIKKTDEPICLDLRDLATTLKSKACSNQASQIKLVIRRLYAIGLRVIATVCDQGATNRHNGRTSKRRKVEKNKTFEVDGEEIIPLYDPPHLIKGIRNNLIIKFKIDDRHVVPNKISKMKVKCATQVISRSVAANMGYLASMGILPKECQETADLLLFFDNVFESVNGSYGNSKKRAGKPLLGPVTPNSSHKKVWAEAKKIISSMKFCNNEKTFQPGPPREFFWCIRSHEYKNTSPSCAGFEAAYASLLINNFNNTHSPGSNCEVDKCFNLKSLKNLFFKKPEASSYVMEVDFDDRQDPKIKAQLEYVTGYVLRKLKVKKCKDCMRSFYSENKENESYLHFREDFKNKTSLTYPSISLIKCFSNIQDIVTGIIRKDCKKKNIRQYMKTILSVVLDYSFIKCKEHKVQLISKIEDLCINLFIFSWCKDTNKLLCGSRKDYDAEDKIQESAFYYCKKRLK
ncbi:hypothetical protein HW555_013897 [Spodoptera exigua]|uniref:HTH psq-type domain-containing protein n=1 Tax=Spodoptera exigua TaxID=7107 RepID=A0A835G4S9_SPOEX|nr:hypothetical protein HW555_013897 [Spodoptera exigua]